MGKVKVGDVIRFKEEVVIVDIFDDEITIRNESGEEYVVHVESMKLIDSKDDFEKGSKAIFHEDREVTCVMDDEIQVRLEDGEEYWTSLENLTK
ncbi:hypothetical protein [Listeria seeligeri]|uniref:hypothetical protein n=1 Tax=Listeria seeligeri TaxID=1640 RepID=UPI00311AD53E